MTFTIIACVLFAAAVANLVRVLLNRRKRGIASFQKIALPVVRASFPTNPISDLVGVEPMTEAKGSTYTLNFRAPTEREKAATAKEREIKARGRGFKHPDIPGTYWKISEADLRVLVDLDTPHMASLRADLIQYPDARIVFYDGIGMLSGSAGAALMDHEERVIGVYPWVLS